MSKPSVARTADKACKYLEMTAAAVGVIGVLLAIASLVFGFFVNEPWVYGPVAASEDWHSVLVGAIGAVVILVQTGIVYSILLGLDAVVEDVYERNDIGDTPSDTAD